MDLLSNLFDVILGSKILQGIALILALITGVLTLFDRIPSQFKPLSERLLFLVLGYLGVAFLRWVIRKTIDELHYLYRAKRYGMGYSNFRVQCIISENGSARIVREVEVEAYSEVSEIDTFVRMEKENFDELSGNIRLGSIKSKSGRKLNLVPFFEKNPGISSANITFAPPLKAGDREHYSINDFYLPEGLYGIAFSDSDTPKKMFKWGWHVNRPIRKLIIRVQFPYEMEPRTYSHNVVTSAAAGKATENVKHGEKKRLILSSLEMIDGRQTLHAEIDYPLCGLIYLIRWDWIRKN